MIFFKESGFGDDLMVFWAVVAGTLLNLIPCGLHFFFERPQTREFLLEVAAHFPEIELVRERPSSKNITYIRHTSWLFRDHPLGYFGRMFFLHNAFYEPYYHKWLTEYGRNYQPGPWVSLAIATGALKVWRPPYEETYDGWQQLAIALDLTQKKAGELAGALSEAWVMMRERLPTAETDNGDVLFFPGGGSSQNLGQFFIERIKSMIPDVKIARFQHDPQEADIRYETIGQLADKISQARMVLTTDSLPSHVAQFYAGKHVLFCTRSHPGNVCFPKAGNTTVFDLGSSLKCRPCLYTLSHQPCPAGHAFCEAQNNQ